MAVLLSQLRYRSVCMFVSDTKMWLRVSKSDITFVGKCATGLLSTTISIIEKSCDCACVCRRQELTTRLWREHLAHLPPPFTLLLFLFMSLPLAHIPPVIPLLPFPFLLPILQLCFPFSSLSSLSILSPSPLGLAACWMWGGWVEFDSMSMSVSVSHSHKHITIRNTSTLVQSCSSVNTSLLVVCMVNVSTSVSFCPVFRSLDCWLTQCNRAER